MPKHRVVTKEDGNDGPPKATPSSRKKPTGAQNHSEGVVRLSGKVPCLINGRPVPRGVVVQENSSRVEDVHSRWWVAVAETSTADALGVWFVKKCSQNFEGLYQ